MNHKPIWSIKNQPSAVAQTFIAVEISQAGRASASDILRLHPLERDPFCGGMTRFGLHLSLAVLLAAFAGGRNTTPRQQTPRLISTKCELLRSHLTGVSNADLNRAAIEGLLTNLRGKVSLIPVDGTAENAAGPLTTRSMVLEDDVAYVRVAAWQPVWPGKSAWPSST
jgi:hypothetical protein